MPQERPERVVAVQTLIEEIGGLYGASEAQKDLVYRIIECENRELDPNLQSRIKRAGGPNGREDSWGISQIHLPDWPGISQDDARDPVYSVRFILAHVMKGKASLWSCYKKVK